jgi:hypothetical protein
MFPSAASHARRTASVEYRDVKALAALGAQWEVEIALTGSVPLEFLVPRAVEVRRKK